MYSKAYKMKEDEYRFLAAIQGIELEQEQSETEAVIRRAQAKAIGMSQEQFELDGMFEFIDGDEI